MMLSVVIRHGGEGINDLERYFASLMLPMGAKVIFNGAIVFEVQSDSGQTIAKDVLLGAGTYTVSLMGSTTDGSVLGQLQLTARFAVLSDPIGPSLMGPTGTTPYGTMTSPPIVPPPVTTPPTSPPTITVPPVVTPIDPYMQGYYWEPLPTDAMMSMWW